MKTMTSDYLDNGRIQAMELLHRMNTRLLVERNYPALAIGQRLHREVFHDVITAAQYNEYLANFTASGNANSDKKMRHIATLFTKNNR